MEWSRSSTAHLKSLPLHQRGSPIDAISIDPQLLTHRTPRESSYFRETSISKRGE